ncbi:Hypothetical protein, putative [Bodo saltans]|uniref:Uncharacterized protein n=1 Tax=Bodo saltans TaxID=75058 RepID=A0A0S4JD24_BODSA|nr:Hypothetical protein, putative [Bodo saltans]|eukprot:CUG88026.1 Hypothetical protein, putative [Bodo saltans]
MLSSRVVERQRAAARQSMHNRVTDILNGPAPMIRSTTSSTANEGRYTAAAFDDGSTPTVSLLMNLILRKQQGTQTATNNDGSVLLSSPVVPDTSFKQNPRASSTTRQSGGPSPMSPDDDDGGYGLLSPASGVGGGAGDFHRVESFASPSPAVASPERNNNNINNNNIAGAAASPLSAASPSGAHQVTFVGDGDASGGSPFKTQFLPSALMALTTDNISRSRYDAGGGGDSDDDDAAVVAAADSTLQRGGGGAGGGARGGGAGTARGRGAKPFSQPAVGPSTIVSDAAAAAAVPTTYVAARRRRSRWWRSWWWCWHCAGPSGQTVFTASCCWSLRHCFRCGGGGCRPNNSYHGLLHEPVVQTKCKHQQADECSAAAPPAAPPRWRCNSNNNDNKASNSHQQSTAPKTAPSKTMAKKPLPKQQQSQLTLGASGFTSSLPALSSIMDTGIQDETANSNLHVDTRADVEESGLGLLSPPHAVDTTYPSAASAAAAEARNVTNAKAETRQQPGNAVAVAATAFASSNKGGVDAATEVDRFTRLVSHNNGKQSAVGGGGGAFAAQVGHIAAQIEEEVHRVQLRDQAIHKTSHIPPLVGAGSGQPPRVLPVTVTTSSAMTMAQQEKQELALHLYSLSAMTMAQQEKQELALHLYSLKQQVVMLSHMTSALVSAAPPQQQQQGQGGILLQSSADFGASMLRNTARRNGGGGGGRQPQQQSASGPVTVHVVRDYDAPIVAYRKSSAAQQQQQQQQPQFSSKPPIPSARGQTNNTGISINASSGQYSSDFVTTTGSLPRKSYASGGNFSASIAEDSLVMASSSWGGR